MEEITVYEFEHAENRVQPIEEYELSSYNSLKYEDIIKHELGKFKAVLNDH